MRDAGRNPRDSNGGSEERPSKCKSRTHAHRSWKDRGGGENEEKTERRVTECKSQEKERRVILLSAEVKPRGGKGLQRGGSDRSFNFQRTTELGKMQSNYNLQITTKL